MLAAASMSGETLMQRVSARPQRAGFGVSRRNLFAGSTILLILLIAALIAALLLTAGHAPKPLTTNGPIAYASGGSIHVVDPSGTTHDLGALAASSGDGGYCCNLSWSPDGRRLLVVSDTEVVVAKPDGTGAVVLTTASDHLAGMPAWSPDSTRIAMPFVKDHGSQIFVMNADGSNRQQVSSQVFYANPPSWSPDGTQIAFGGADLPDGTIAHLYVAAADGSSIRRVADAPAGQYLSDYGAPSWSPDGKRIAFDTKRYGQYFELWTVNADGSGLARLGDADANGLLPQWSPDGAHIAFPVWGPDTGQVDLYVIAADGSGLTKLAEQVASDGIAWSPDSKRILFEQGYDGQCSLQRTYTCPDPQDNPYNQVLSVGLDGSPPQTVLSTSLDGGLAWGGQP
jgi:TolB protein